MPKLARLNPAGDLLAIDDVTPDEWQDGPAAVRVPDHTDLQPGRAVWDPMAGTFHIKGGQRPPGAPAMIGDLTPIVLAFMALRKAGAQFPKVTDQWLDDWASSLYASGLIDRKGNPL